MRNIITITRRELLSFFFFSSTAYIVLSVFLFINGGLFYIYFKFTQGHPGFIVQAFFGRSFFFWMPMLLLPSFLTMRLLAEERKMGTFDVLMSVPVTEIQVVVGKYLASLICFTLIWLSTLLIFLGAWKFKADFDWGTILSGYIGTISLGAFFLSIGLFASSLTKNQIVAVTLGVLISGGIFAVYFLRYLFSQFDDVSICGGSLMIIQIIDYLSPVSHFQEFGRGVVNLGFVLQYLLGTLLFLYLTFLSIRLSRRYIKIVSIGYILLFWVIFICGHVLTYKYVSLRFDTTRSSMYTLSEMSEKAIQRLREPVTVYVLKGSQEDTLIYEVFDKATALLKEYSARSPLIDILEFNADSDSKKIQNIIKVFNIQSGENIVIFSLKNGERYRFLHAGDLADFEFFTPSEAYLPSIPTSVKRFKGEQAFTDALLALMTKHTPVVYLTFTHGEFRSLVFGGRGFGKMSSTLKSMGYALRDLDLLRNPEIPDDCNVLIIGGPSQPFQDHEALAVNKYLLRGGSVLVLLDPLDTSGLESTLSQWGIHVNNDVILELIPISGNVFNVTDEIFTANFGAREHPVTKGLPYRVFLSKARSLKGETSDLSLNLTPLILTEFGRLCWGERDLRTYQLRPNQCRFNKDIDTPPPMIIGLASEKKKEKGNSYRLVVIGNSDFATDEGITAFFSNKILFFNIFHWLSRQEDLISIPPKEDESIRLILSPLQESALWWFCVIILPLFGVSIGVILYMVRKG